MSWSRNVRRMNLRWLPSAHETLNHQLTASLSSSSKLQKQSSNQYCVDMVRKFDHENFLACLLLPNNIQRAAFALRAFSIEVAQVQDIVTEKQIGQMRMQFWKDSMTKIFKYTNVPQSPIAVELAGACRHYKLSKRWLDRIIDGRISHLESDKFMSVKSVEDHAENVTSSLYYLMLECAGIKNVQADHAASHLGKAHGLVTVLRATPHHASRRRVYIPIEILAQHKVSQEDFIQGKTSPSMTDAVFSMASIAYQHLEKARSLQKGLSKEANLIFLNAVVCDTYLKRLQKVDFNLFDGTMQAKDHLLSGRMYMNKLKGKF